MLAFIAGCWIGLCAGIVLAAALQMGRDGDRRQAREP